MKQLSDFMAVVSRCLMKISRVIVMRCDNIQHPFIDLI